MTTDWRQALGAMLEQMPPTEQTTETKAADAPTAPAAKPILKLFFEKRRGKPSTIISGYDESCAESRALASSLKQRLACGGSERDGEILLQGDVRERLRPLLQADGYNVKG